MNVTYDGRDNGISDDNQPTIRASDVFQPERIRQTDNLREIRDPDATQASWKRTKGIDSVVGWLVCIAGPDKGRDYRVCSERNTIGRDPSMQICISGDNTISREKHAIISYNPRKNSFLILPGEGRALVYLNDEEVVTPTPLNPYDLIELGHTRLMFIALCGSRFQWDSDTSGGNQQSES